MYEQNLIQDMRFNFDEESTESVTPTDAVSAIPKMSKEECQQKTDEELLNMLQKAQGHTGKDFPDFMNCDFSYSYLTSVLRDRGYENGWHKVADSVSSPKPTLVKMKKSEEETVRVSYMVDRSIAEEWKRFNQHVPYKTVTLGCAMRRFMEDVRSGRIKFELEI